MKKARFTTLEYPNGPVLPPAYKPLGYKLQEKTLSPLAEEMLFSIARYIESDYWPKIVKAGNFWNCLKPEVSGKLNFPEDFMPVLKLMKSDQEAAKLAKKALTKEEKINQKLEKEELKKKHGFVILNGKNADLGGFMIEAPSLIITRGNDPRIGNWKYRVREEDITLNTKTPPKGWKGKTVFDPSAIWVISYQVNCGIKGTKTFKSLNKRVCFASTTDVWQESRGSKFDKSTNILKNWKKIQKHILDGIKSDDKKTQEAALIAYLIQQTGIRIGNERDLSKQADTKGASTLTKANIELL